MVAGDAQAREAAREELRKATAAKVARFGSRSPIRIQVSNGFVCFVVSKIQHEVIKEVVGPRENSLQESAKLKSAILGAEKVGLHEQAGPRLDMGRQFRR